MQKLQINFHAQVFFIIIIIYSIEVLENGKEFFSYSISGCSNDQTGRFLCI